jgi:hypothetical protein
LELARQVLYHLSYTPALCVLIKTEKCMHQGKARSTTITVKIPIANANQLFSKLCKCISSHNGHKILRNVIFLSPFYR